MYPVSSPTSSDTGLAWLSYTPPWGARTTSQFTQPSCWTLSSHHHRIPAFARGTSVQLLPPIPGAQRVPASLTFLQTAPLPKPSWGQAKSGLERNTQVGRVGKGGTLEVALDPGICGMLRAWSHRLSRACRATMEDPGNHLPRGPGASRGETRKAVRLWLPNSGDAQQERRESESC